MLLHKGDYMGAGERNRNGNRFAYSVLSKIFFFIDFKLESWLDEAT